MSSTKLTQLPKRASTHRYEDESRRRFGELFSDPYFICRSETENDYGVDCEIEALVDDGASVSNMRTQAQLKSTNNGLNSDGSLSYSVAVSNLSYLLNCPNSFYALYHQPTAKFYWKYAHDVYAEASGSGKSWDETSIAVRCHQTLDQSAVEAIHTAIVEYGCAAREIRLREPSNAAALDSLKVAAQAASLANELDAALGIIVSEAIRHYEDGLRSYQVEQLRQARSSFDRAINLFQVNAPQRGLRAKILVTAASVCILLHDLFGAERHLRAVEELLGTAELDSDLREAGAVALEQRASIAASDGTWNAEIRSMFEQAAAHFRTNEDYFNLARSIHAAAESALQAHHPEEAYSVLEPFFDAVESISDVRVAAYMMILGLATLANINLVIAESLPRDDNRIAALIEPAIKNFEQVLEFAEKSEIPDLTVKTRLALAKCFWFTGQYEKAIELSEGIVTPQTLEAFPREYMFGAFNLALIKAEIDETRAAIEIFSSIRPLFGERGDVATVIQIDQFIQELHRQLASH